MAHRFSFTAGLAGLALLATVLQTGCPPTESGAPKALGKALFNAGCRGCDPRENNEMTVLLPGNVALELVRIPAGSFLMGRGPNELDSNADEQPRHEVTFTQGFWMGKHEVTQQQWLALRNTWPGTPPSAAHGLGFTYPAYNLSWNDAQVFMAALNTHIISTSQGPLTVRLPSESEWEYACRAGTQTRFFFGDSPDCAADCSDCAAGASPENRGDYMWYCGNNSPGGSKPVGGKTPNAFGLYDMSGNVYEWCEDDYHDTYTYAPAYGSAWVDAPRGPYRVARGGAWGENAKFCRSAYRGIGTPGSRTNTHGFRVAAF